MRYFFFFLLTLFAVTGCHTPKPSSHTSGIGDIGVELWASSNCVSRGETVKLRATATNHGSYTFTNRLTNRAVLDIVVKTSGKTARWSDGKSLTPDLTQLVLKPGESKSIEMDWHVQGQDSLLVNADFAYDDRLGVAPSTSVMVEACAGPFGP